MRQISRNSFLLKKNQFLFQKFLKMEDSVHNPDKFVYCKIKDHCQKENYSQFLKYHGKIKLYKQYKSCSRFQIDKSWLWSNQILQEKYPKSCIRVIIDKSCRFRCGCAYMHQDHSEERNKKMIYKRTRKSWKAIQKEIDQLKATAQHI